MVRNILLASLICMFAMFGALGAKDVHIVLTCIGIALITCLLCFWRCAVLYKKISEKKWREQMFSDYSRKNFNNRSRY